MNEAPIQSHSDTLYQEEVMIQQEMMIGVFKQEIIRLQDQISKVQGQRNQYMKLYEKSLKNVETLKDQVNQLKNKNQCLLQTLQVFHKEFIKTDHHNIYSESEDKHNYIEKPFFQELLQNIKSKFNSDQPSILKITQRSALSDYYGLFLHEKVNDCEIELFQHVKSSKRIKSSKIKSYGKKHCFNEKFRHVFWFNSIENYQRITYSHFQILLEAFDHNPEVNTHSLIDLDLRRMDFKIQEEKSKQIKKQIKTCLQLFSLYRPDIGYVQGMSYLAWMLSIRMKTFEAFVCFSNLILNDPFIHSLYFFQKEKIEAIIAFFEECLAYKKPKLSRHLKKLEVQSQFFIYEWAYTFFTRAFNLRIVSKIWDLWFSEGFNVFFKVCMVIMDMLEVEILQQKQNNQVIDLLRNQTHGLDQNEFIRQLSRQRLFEDLAFHNF